MVFLVDEIQSRIVMLHISITYCSIFLNPILLSMYCATLAKKELQRLS